VGRHDYGVRYRSTLNSKPELEPLDECRAAYKREQYQPCLFSKLGNICLRQLELLPRPEAYACCPQAPRLQAPNPLTPSSVVGANTTADPGGAEGQEQQDEDVAGEEEEGGSGEGTPERSLHQVAPTVLDKQQQVAAKGRGMIGAGCAVRARM
jgi:hypothetical protein